MVPMPPARKIKIPHEGDGLDVLTVLSKYLEMTAPDPLVRLVKQGLLRDLDGTPLSERHRLKSQQECQLNLELLVELKAPNFTPVILFDDQRLVALDKPPGVLVHPSGGLFQWTMVDWTRLRFADADIDLVHRLDRQTSGVLLLTKDKSFNASVKNEFAAQRVEKTYLAVVENCPTWSQRTCNAPIGKSTSGPKTQRKVTQSGKPAKTEFTKIKCFQKTALIRCHPRSGRSHQIRVHLSHIGHPLIGDLLYAPDAKNPMDHSLSRHALHCAQLALQVRDHCAYRIDSPIPADLAALLHDHANIEASK